MKVKSSIWADFERGENIVLGFSGGADSCALFHLLAESGLGLQITAVHVNHGLRGEESDGDEAFCGAITAGYNSTYITYRTDITALAKEKKITEEEAGREFRYQAFAEAAEKCGATKVVVAHNMDDNAETMIMRFLRGTGLAGLAGIPYRRERIIRPLLYTGRKEIEDYLRANNIPFRLDSTNDENDYTRNKIRNVILPQIVSNINPRAAENIAKSAEMFGAEDKFLQSLAVTAYEGCLIDKNEWSIKLTKRILNTYDRVITMRVIRLAYAALNGSVKDLSGDNVGDAAALLFMERGKRVSLPGGITARVGDVDFSLEKTDEREKKIFFYETDLKNDVYIRDKNILVTFGQRKNFAKQCTILFSYDKIKDSDFVFRTREPGDRIALEGSGHQKLKDFLTGRKLSQQEKDDLFYLADGSDIVAVLSAGGCIRVSGDYLPGKHSESVTIVLNMLEEGEF